MINFLKVWTTQLLLIIAMVLFISTSKGIAAEEDDWQFTVEPYLMGTNIEGDTRLGRPTGVDVDVDFGDILENLEAAFMINGSVYHKSGWGILVDYGFMKLGKDTSGPVGGIIDAEVRQGVLETFIAKQFSLQQASLEFYTGIRWWDNDIDVSVDPAIRQGSVTLSVDEDWVDPVVGSQLTMGITERFDLIFRGDVGGFGISSDFTALIAAGVHCRLTELISLDLRYKAIWVDYETGTEGTPGYFSYKTVTHGPILGVIFNF